MFWGLGIAAVYKFVTDGLKLFPSEVEYGIDAYKAPPSAWTFCRRWRVWAISAARAFRLTWLRGQHARVVRARRSSRSSAATSSSIPADVSVAELWATGGTGAIWGKFIRYIGAGALAAGRHHQPDQVPADDRAHVRRGLQVLR